ncbi:hypothetical protein CEXT_517961 [Caerostris extrusa]|uniref:Uncharacterized protein n=1 Tax=Caerostris extrusa TaxID=172846 RepID=A0AAV4SHE1_CAEEX|nr:hypothetical protein CEXT_517961 [Caerostris extrusa]
MPPVQSRTELQLKISMMHGRVHLRGVNRYVRRRKEFRAISEEVNNKRLSLRPPRILLSTRPDLDVRDGNRSSRYLVHRYAIGRSTVKKKHNPRERKAEKIEKSSACHQEKGAAIITEDLPFFQRRSQGPTGPTRPPEGQGARAHSLGGPLTVDWKMLEKIYKQFKE